jgi:hypothetical protein
MNPEIEYAVARIMDVFRLLYADLWLRQRAMIEILGRHGVAIPEHFEAEVTEWMKAHRETAGAEAIARLEGFLENLDRAAQEDEGA